MKRQAQNVLPPPILHGQRITEFHDGRKLFLRAECERGALVQEDLFVRPPKAAKSWQRYICKLSLTLSEHNARRTAPGVAHATKANVLTLLFAPQHCRARPAQSLPTRCVWQRGGTRASGADQQCQASQRNSTYGQMLDPDVTPQEGMITV